MTHARAAALVMWACAAGFGLSTIPVALYLRWRGQLPTFFDLFEMYGGPWSARLAQSTFIGLLVAFLAVNAVTAWAAWLLWNGSKPGAVLSLALLPVEGVFWVGFALPSRGCSAPCESSSSSLRGGRSPKPLRFTGEGHRTSDHRLRPATS